MASDRGKIEMRYGRRRRKDVGFRALWASSYMSEQAEKDPRGETVSETISTKTEILQCWMVL